MTTNNNVKKVLEPSHDWALRRRKLHTSGGLADGGRLSMDAGLSQPSLEHPTLLHAFSCGNLALSKPAQWAPPNTVLSRISKSSVAPLQRSTSNSWDGRFPATGRDVRSHSTPSKGPLTVKEMQQQNRMHKFLEECSVYYGNLDAVHRMVREVKALSERLNSRGMVLDQMEPSGLKRVYSAVETIVRHLATFIRTIDTSFPQWSKVEYEEGSAAGLIKQHYLPNVNLLADRLDDLVSACKTELVRDSADEGRPPRRTRKVDDRKDLETMHPFGGLNHPEPCNPASQKLETAPPVTLPPKGKQMVKFDVVANKIPLDSRDIQGIVSSLASHMGVQAGDLLISEAGEGEDSVLFFAEGKVHFGLRLMIHDDGDWGSTKAAVAVGKLVENLDNGSIRKFLQARHGIKFKQVQLMNTPVLVTSEATQVCFDGRALISRIQLQESMTSEKPDSSTSLQPVGIDRMFDFVMSIADEKPCSEVLQSVELAREMFDKAIDAMQWGPVQTKENKSAKAQFGTDRGGLLRPASVCDDSLTRDRVIACHSGRSAHNGGGGLKGATILSVLQSEIAARAGELEEKHSRRVQKDQFLYKSMSKELLSGKEGLSGRSKMDGVHVWRDSTLGSQGFGFSFSQETDAAASRHALDTDQLYQKALTGLDYFDKSTKRDSLLPCLSPISTIRPASRCAQANNIFGQNFVC